MCKVISLLAGFTFSVVPALVHAYQIAPNPNPSGSTITVITLDAENITNLQNDGFLYISGTLTNYGALNNNTSSSLQFNQSPGTGTGTLNNFGTLNIAGGIAFTDEYVGTVNNYSSFTNTGSGYLGHLNNDNTFTNSGHLDLGNMQNAGTATNNSSILLWSGGQISNSGTLDNFGDLALEDSGLTNTGTLNNSGVIAGVEFSSGVNNSGILNNSGTLSSSMAGSLHNSGLLNNSGTLNNNGLYGMTNTGTLNNIGTMNNTGNNGIGDGLNNTGTLNNAGTLNNISTLNNSGTIAGTGTYIQTYGQTINNGSFTQGTIQIEGGSLSGTGTMSGNVIIGSGASVNPGNSPGTMTINGDFTSGGTIVFEIAGLNSGLYDVLDINGNAKFKGGSIQFDFIDGYSAVAGNYWDFLSANTIAGWDTLSFTFNGLGTGLGWNITQLSTGSERLWITSVTPPVPESDTYAMLLVGLGLLGFVSIRRKRPSA